MARLAPGLFLETDAKGALMGADAAARFKAAMVKARDACLARAHRARESALELHDMEARHQDECAEIEGRIGEVSCP